MGRKFIHKAEVLNFIFDKALKSLRGWEDVDGEIQEIYQEDQSEKAEGRLSVRNLCTFRPLRWQLIIIIALNMGQQLSGINAVSDGNPVNWSSNHQCSSQR